METSKSSPAAYHPRDVEGAFVRRAALLTCALALAACRQIAGIQDLPKPCADPNTIDDSATEPVRI
jgi:hypothetical protein